MTLLKQNASWLGRIMNSIEYTDPQEAITGRLDDNGNLVGDPTTGATPGKIWIRLNAGRAATQAVIGALMWQYAAVNNLRILTGINRSGVRVAIKRAEDEEAVYTIGNQLNSPEARNDPMPTRLLTGGRVLPRGDTATPGLTVFVEAYPQGGLVFDNPAFDISADEPGNAGEYGWSVIYITSAGVLASAPSTPRLLPTADGLLIQDALDVVIPAGAIRLQAVSLYNGQTDVLASNSRFLELRDFVSPLGVLSVVAGSGVTVDNTDPRNPIVASSGGGGGGGFSGHILLRDEKAANTSAGTFTSGAWRTRDLNTEVIDTANHCTLSGNEFTLAAGTYNYYASAPAYTVVRHQVRLYDVTGAAMVTNGEGTSEISMATTGGGIQTRSFVAGRFTIGTTTTFRLEHRCETTVATFGLGLASNFGIDEIYAIVELWRE